MLGLYLAIAAIWVWFYLVFSEDHLLTGVLLGWISLFLFSISIICILIAKHLGKIIEYERNLYDN